jgi:predicted DCC family thiol-disulfide oxidoreductase YuxK
MTSATTQVDAVLPDPDACPGRAVLIYDGHCRFCVANVRILRALDLGGRVAFLSLHDQRVAERYSDLSHERLMREMHLVDGAGAGDGTRTGTGTVYGGAAAFRRLTRLMPLLWPLAPLLHLPFSLPLWSWLYDIVARHRYRFGRLDGCDNGACAVHFGPRRT